MNFYHSLRRLTSGRLFLSVVLFISLFFVLSFPVIAASCIPPNEDITGCTFDGNGSGVCAGVYKELDDPPKCDNGFDRIRQFTCSCSYTNKAYLCPDGDVRFNNNVWTGSTIDPLYVFCGNIQNETSTVSKTVATDLAACQNWCQSIVSLPTATPTPPCLYSGISGGSCTLPACSPNCPSGYETCSFIGHPNAICSRGGSSQRTGCCGCPTILSLSCAGGNNINVSWTPVIGAVDYYVYRDNNEIARFITGTSYTDTGATCGISHSYDVKTRYASDFMDCQQNIPVICACPTSIPTPTSTPTPTNTPTSTPTPTPTCAQTPPVSVSLVSPANYEELKARDVTLSWNAPASWGNGCPSNSNRYFVYLASTYNGGNLDDDDPAPDLVSPPTTTLGVSGLTDGQMYYWQVEADNIAGCASANCRSFSAVRAFSINLGNDPWFQTQGGNIHAESWIISRIPACATTPKYLSLDGDGGTPGVISWGSISEPNIGIGDFSSLDWQAETTFKGSQKSFTFLKNRLRVSTTKALFTGPMPQASGTYYADSNKSLSGSFPTGEKIVLFVDGDVIVGEDIIVPQGSFFALISSGNISFNGTVTQAEGFFLANGSISTGISNQPFAGEGSFIGWSGVYLQRDLGTDLANCTPSETFTQRPDFFLNAPSSFKRNKSRFWESAP